MNARYVLKKLESKNPRVQNYHVLYEGRPVGLLTNSHSYHKTGNNLDWGLYALATGNRVQVRGRSGSRLFKELIKDLQDIDPAVFQAAPTYVVVLDTAYGDRLYHAAYKRDEGACMGASGTYLTRHRREATQLTEPLALATYNQLPRQPRLEYEGDWVTRVSLQETETGNTVISREMTHLHELYTAEKA